MVTQRDIQAKATRTKILEAASAEIYRVGYQSASLCDILNRLGISKGALYHHFPGKRELGYAVLDEVLSHKVAEMWGPAVFSEDPISGIVNLLNQCHRIKKLGYQNTRKIIYDKYKLFLFF